MLLRLFLLLFVVINVCCDDDAEEQKKVNREIGEMVCSDEDRPKNWFKCIMCCQGMNPFELVIYFEIIFIVISDQF